MSSAPVVEHLRARNSARPACWCSADVARKVPGMNVRQKMFARLYRGAGNPQTLPWHREEPPALLARIVAARHPGPAGSALDLGCGSGVHAVYLAQHGFSVVAVDFVAAALDLASARAESARVPLQLCESDVLDFDSPTGFDVVLDSGCLHHIPSSKVDAYLARLDRWLLPGGDYLLVHFAKRHALDRRPGGHRRTREEITQLFSSLRLEAHDETFFNLSFPMGSTLAGIYWFRRPAI